MSSSPEGTAKKVSPTPSPGPEGSSSDDNLDFFIMFSAMTSSTCSSCFPRVELIFFDLCNEATTRKPSRDALNSEKQITVLSFFFIAKQGR